jgi:NTP pyrophosphatase (non-canonical NTP hydrolase)
MTWPFKRIYNGWLASFQKRTRRWFVACFSEEDVYDIVERNHRFLEEALELFQACGCTASEAHQLVDYVFSRPVGDIEQEIGGVLTTLAMVCSSEDIDLKEAGETELARMIRNIAKIRTKQAEKPKYSPKPESGDN